MEINVPMEAESPCAHVYLTRWTCPWKSVSWQHHVCLMWGHPDFSILNAGVKREYVFAEDVIILFQNADTCNVLVNVAKNTPVHRNASYTMSLFASNLVIMCRLHVLEGVFPLLAGFHWYIGSYLGVSRLFFDNPACLNIVNHVCHQINVSSAVLKAAAHHYGSQCDKPNKEFMLCRWEEKDPRKCLEEGRKVNECALNFFRWRSSISDNTQIHAHGQEFWGHNVRVSALVVRGGPFLYRQHGIDQPDMWINVIRIARYYSYRYSVSV